EVARVLRGMRPERLLADPAAPALLDRHRQHGAGAAADRLPAANGVVAADLAQLLGEHRAVFDPVAVGVDDRMVEARFDLRGSEISAHGYLALRDSYFTRSAPCRTIRPAPPDRAESRSRHSCRRGRCRGPHGPVSTRFRR